MIHTIITSTAGQGLWEITSDVQAVITGSGADTGLCTLFMRHTSASLLIQENADQSARQDLESWLNRLVPEVDSLYTHTYEGPDDMPAHIKSMLTQTNLAIPFTDSRLLLGTWQGIFLWEHRHRSHTRQVIVHIMEDK